MFREALLESSPALRRRNPWPMATAFTLQMVIASVIVLLSLISTGTLPLSLHTVVPLPPRYTPIEPQQPPVSGGSHNSLSLPSRAVISVGSNNPVLPNPWAHPTQADNSDVTGEPRLNIGSAIGIDIPMQGTPIPPAQPRRIIISHSMEAMLISKVVPEYPAIARVAGVQGDVQLHAIIARDGTIQSLAVTGGPVMLQEAARKAVAQWRYRPYVLNGQAVEVETIITVSFRRF